MIYWFYLPSYGGIQSIMETLAIELTKLGHKIYILTGPFPGSPNHEKINGIEVFRTEHLSRKHKTDYRGLFHFVDKFIQTHEIDVLHLHNFQRPHRPRQTMALYHAAITRGVPSIMHVHIPVEKIKERFMLRYLDWDAIVPVSKYVAKLIVKKGYFDSKILPVPNCVDTEKFSPANKNKKYETELARILDLDLKKPILLLPCRLLDSKGKFEERKGIKTFIHALSHLKDMGHEFTGVITAIESENFPEESRKAKRNLKKFAEVMGVGKMIRIPKENLWQRYIPTLYNSSSVVLIPSQGEAFGIVALEGMACEKPVIGCISGALPEVIRHEKTGLLVNPDSPFDLSQALHKFLSDKRLAKKYGKAGRKLVIKEYSASKIVKPFVKLYEEIIHNAKSN